MFNLRKMPLDFNAEIEKLKSQEKGREEEAVEVAKKLRSEIEQQMEKSFEMIEESQNEVKDFLTQRKKDEDEHKSRTAEIVRKLEDEINNVDNDINDNVKNSGRNSSEEPGLDSKSGEADNTTLISKDAKADESGTGTSTSEGTGVWNSQKLKLDDIPDVIESIKEDLIENMKIKLSDERERLKGGREAKASLLKQDTCSEATDGHDTNTSKDALHSTLKSTDEGQLPFSRGNRKLAELSKAVVENEMQREREADSRWNIDGDNPIDNDYTLRNLQHVISDHRNQLENGLLSDIHTINDVPGISLKGKKSLADAYTRMKNNFDNLAQLVIKDKIGDLHDFTGSERLMQCRKLCREIDYIEGLLDKFNNAISSQVDTDGDYPYAMANDIMKNVKDTASGDQPSAVPLVATLEGDGDEDNVLFEHKQTPVTTDERKQLSELLQMKIDAEEKLNARLDDLKAMLDQGPWDDVKMDELENKLFRDDLEELEVSEGLVDLKHRNEKLQRELDKVYKANNELMKENCKLREDVHGTLKGRSHKYEDVLQHIGYLEIPRWENEKIMKQNLDELKKVMGEEIYDDILYGKKEIEVPFTDLEDYQSMRQENRNFQDLLNEYKADVNSLAEKLIMANVVNEINEITKVDTRNTKRAMEELQKEAAKTEEMLTENESDLKENEHTLNKLILKRNLKLEEEHEQLKEKLLLERQIAELNKAIHEFFPFSEVKKQREDIERRIRSIDNEIALIGKELKEESTDGRDERMTEVQRLETLLEKLKPHVRREREMQLENEMGKLKQDIPDDLEVDKAIARKEDLKKCIDGSSEVRSKQIQGDLHDDEGNIQVLMVSANNDGYVQKLEGLKQDLKSILKEMVSSGLENDDAVYLREAVESLKSSIEETKNDLEHAKAQSTKASSSNEELAEIEKKIEYLTEILSDEEKSKTFEDELLGSDGDLTQLNIEEKIETTRKRLKAEKQRLEMIIESTKNLESERSISTVPDFNGFQKAFNESTAAIKSEIEESMDDVMKILRSSSDKLRSKKFESTEGKENKELSQRREKLSKLKRSIARLNRDLTSIDKFEKEGEAGEISDSDMEELIYKIEAIKVSIERMEKTIEEHVHNDGDAKTLEVLTKRRNKMKETRDEAITEVNRRNGMMKRDLLELMNEKIRIESEVKEILGTGTINSDEERQAMIELIEDARSYDFLQMNKDDGDLVKYLAQRQKIAEDYQDFIELGGLTEEDGKFLSTMVDSIDVDMKERLDEIQSDCNEYSEDNAYENTYLNVMLRNRSELQSALYALDNVGNEDRNKTALSIQMEGGDMSYTAPYEQLWGLASEKIKAIDIKIDLLNDITKSQVILGKTMSNDNGDSADGFQANDKGLEELLKLVKNEIASFQVVDRFDEDWNGLTASLLDEVSMKNETDVEINKLIEEREELIRNFLNAKGSDTVDFGGSDELGYSEQISNIDERILDQRNLYIDAKPVIHTSPSITDDEDILFEKRDQQETLLKSLFQERDFVIRQLFALKTRESSRWYTAVEIEAVKGISALKSDLEHRLEELDTAIKGCSDMYAWSPVNRTQSPNVYAMMRMIDEEIGRLKEEVNGKKLFLYEKKNPESKERKENQQSGEGRSKEEDHDELKEKIRALTEQREYLILSGEEQQDAVSLEDITDRKHELESALVELQNKLELLYRKEQLEKEIEELEREMMVENFVSEVLDGENIHDEREKMKSELEDVESTLFMYALAIEHELGRNGASKNEAMSALHSDDVGQVRDILQQRLEELINNRVKLNSRYEEISEDLKDRDELQNLVEKRKTIVEELDHIKSEINRSGDESIARELHEKRQQYEGISRRQKYLEKKKIELQQTIGYLEQQKEISFEDTTSGFSDHVELDERDKELIFKKDQEIDDLKQEIETLKLQNEQLESEKKEEQQKVTELTQENEDKSETIEVLGEELSSHQKEIEELNDAAEAMMEVANAMDEQNNARSLEIELNRDEIMELKKELNKAKSRDWGAMEANFTQLEATLKDKSKEIDKIMSEKDEISKEVGCLRENMIEVSDELSNEKAKNVILEEQVALLDQLKDELKKKGKRILKIDHNKLYTTSPTEEDITEGRRSNDFKNEIDKVSAVEEIMKLAAEMISENEVRLKKCNDLETQNEELTNMLEDMLEKFQAQNEEIENLKKKIKGTDGVSMKDCTSEVQKEEDIVPVKPKFLMNQLEHGIEDDFDDLITQVTLLSHEKEQLKDELEDERFKNEKLEDTLRAKDEMLSSAESQIEELMGTVRSLIAKNDDLKTMHMKGEQLRQKLERESKEKISRKDREITEERNMSIENKRRAETTELEKQELEHELLLKSTKSDHMSRQIQDLEKEMEDTLKMHNDNKREIEKQKARLLYEKEDLIGKLKEKSNEISSLKSSRELMKMNYEQMEMKQSKEIKSMKLQLKQTNDYSEELQKNFDRVRKAKEQMLVDYDKQIQNLLEEIAGLKNSEVKLSKELESKEETSASMLTMLEDKTSELVKDHRKEMEEIIQSKSKEILYEVNQRRSVEEQLKEERAEHYRQRVRFQEFGNKRETEIEKLNDRIDTLKIEVHERENRIKLLESKINQFETIEKQRDKEDNDITMIRREYESKTMAVNLDLEEAQNENKRLFERVQKLKRILAEKENDLSLIESEYQKEIKDIKKRMVENEIANEKEISLEKIKGAEMESKLKKYKTDSLTTNVYISELCEEKLEMNKELKGLEKLIRQMKEKNDAEIKTRDLRIQKLEAENEELVKKASKTEKKLAKELEEVSKLKSIEREVVKVKGENLAYKERLKDISENLAYKDKVERLENELKCERDDFKKLKNESIQTLKHSNAMKNEIKQAKGKIGEMKKEHKKEQNLLISNLEKEFRKKIEEIIRSNLQEKEKMLQMWDEERENWEAEMKEDLENSKYDLERKLQLQRMDMERSKMNSLAEIMNENTKVVNELNARLNELEFERKQMELKFDQEVKSAENRFAAEKEYMVVLIRELLKSLVDSKSRKNMMNQNHKSEITTIEEAFEKEKEFMNVQLTEELKLLRNKVNKMLSKGSEYEDRELEDMLDSIPRKLY